MKLEQGKFCPLIGKDCMGLECSWFTQIRGSDPQTGAAVESFRNETLNKLSETVTLKMIDEPVKKLEQPIKKLRGNSDLDI